MSQSKDQNQTENPMKGVNENKQKTREEELAFLKAEIDKRNKEREKKEQELFEAALRKKEEQMRHQIASSYEIKQTEIATQAQRNAKRRRRNQSILGVFLLALVSTAGLLGYYYQQGRTTISDLQNQYQIGKTNLQKEKEKQLHLDESQRGQLATKQQELEKQIQQAKEKQTELTAMLKKGK